MEYVVILALVSICLVAIAGLVSRASDRAYQRTASSLNATPAGVGGSRGGSFGLVVEQRGQAGASESPPDSTADDDPAPADSTGESAHHSLISFAP